MINSLKIGALRFGSWLTEQIEPFDEFYRPCPMAKTGLSHGMKADLFESEFIDRFQMKNGVYAYHITSPADIGDQALWHGIAVAMWAFKYGETKKATDGFTLAQAVKAMRHHFVAGSLVRGVDPATGRLADDASNDTATGTLAGLYFAWLYGTDIIREMARPMMMTLGLEIVQHNYCLVRQDATPTTYGRLIDGWKTDPLRASLAIAILAAAYAMTGDAVFREHADFLLSKYGRLLSVASPRFLWLTHSFEAHRAAIHLSILADLLDGKNKERCLEGLRRVNYDERKSANPWILALVSRHIGLDESELRVFRGRQLEYEVEEKTKVVERINSVNADYWDAYNVKFVTWGDHVRASQPLPFHALPSQDFFPQRELRSVDGWQGITKATEFHSGLDYLAAHWLGVLTGLIQEDE